MQASAFAARERSDDLLLIAAFEVEAPQIRARRHFELPDRDEIQSAADVVEHRLCIVERFARLLDDRNFTVGPIRISPESGFSWPAIIRKSVVFPAPLGPMIPTIAPAGTTKLTSSISSRSPYALRHSDEFDDLVAEPLGDRDEDFLCFVAPLIFVTRKLFEARDAALALRPAALDAGAHPLQLALERLPARRLGGFFAGQPLPVSARARNCSCPSTECRVRGRVRGSIRPRYRGNSGRASPRRPFRENAPGTVPATRRFPHRDGSSVRRAAACRA